MVIRVAPPRSRTASWAMLSGLMCFLRCRTPMSASEATACPKTTCPKRVKNIKNAVSILRISALLAHKNIKILCKIQELTCISVAFGSIWALWGGFVAVVGLNVDDLSQLLP